jgi:hypothetical protein
MSMNWRKVFGVYAFSKNEALSISMQRHKSLGRAGRNWTFTGAPIQSVLISSADHRSIGSIDQRVESWRPRPRNIYTPSAMYLQDLPLSKIDGREKRCDPGAGSSPAQEAQVPPPSQTSATGAGPFRAPRRRTGTSVDRTPLQPCAGFSRAAQTGRSRVGRGWLGTPHHLITHADGVPSAVPLIGGNRRHRGIASRFDKLAVRYEAAVTIPAINEWL